MVPVVLCCFLGSRANRLGTAIKRKTEAVKWAGDKPDATGKRPSDERERASEGKFREFTVAAAAGRSPRRTG